MRTTGQAVGGAGGEPKGASTRAGGGSWRRWEDGMTVTGWTTTGAGRPPRGHGPGGGPAGLRPPAEGLRELVR